MNPYKMTIMHSLLSLNYLRETRLDPSSLEVTDTPSNTNLYEISFFFRHFGVDKVYYYYLKAPDLNSLFKLWNLVQIAKEETPPLSSVYNEIPSKPYPSYKKPILVVTNEFRLYNNPKKYIDHDKDYQQNYKGALSFANHMEAFRAQEERERLLNGGKKEKNRQKFSLYYFLKNNAFGFALASFILSAVSYVSSAFLVIFTDGKANPLWLFVLTFVFLIFGGFCNTISD